MKDDTCQTCKHRTGTRCKKNDEYTSLNDWCSAYRFKAADGIIDRYFKEMAIARRDKMFRRMA